MLCTSVCGAKAVSRTACGGHLCCQVAADDACDVSASACCVAASARCCSAVLRRSLQLEMVSACSCRSLAALSPSIHEGITQCLLRSGNTCAQAAASTALVACTFVPIDSICANLQQAFGAAGTLSRQAVLLPRRTRCASRRKAAEWLLDEQQPGLKMQIWQCALNTSLPPLGVIWWWWAERSGIVDDPADHAPIAASAHIQQSWALHGATTSWQPRACTLRLVVTHTCAWVR